MLCRLLCTTSPSEWHQYPGTSTSQLLWLIRDVQPSSVFNRAVANGCLPAEPTPSCTALVQLLLASGFEDWEIVLCGTDLGGRNTVLDGRCGPWRKLILIVLENIVWNNGIKKERSEVQNGLWKEVVEIPLLGILPAYSLLRLSSVHRGGSSLTLSFRRKELSGFSHLIQFLSQPIAVFWTKSIAADCFRLFPSSRRPDGAFSLATHLLSIKQSTKWWRRYGLWWALVMWVTALLHCKIFTIQ